MKPRKPVLTYRSFQDLKSLRAAKSVPLPLFPEFKFQVTEDEQSPDFEEKIFREAMEGVVPISRDERGEDIFEISSRNPVPPEDGGGERAEDMKTVSELTDLIENGTGFHISDTPEYIEGTGYRVSPEIARRLHRGDFAIQAHIDLHRFNVQNARIVFDRFLKWAVITAKRGVLIIHGRGLSSPSPESVLKAKVVEWLTRGPWRKWVVAYASARPCDGGAGATYLLLRQRPVSKRMKSGRKRLNRHTSFS